MWDKSTYDEFLVILNGNNPMKIASWLNRMQNEPCGNPAILPHLEQLLTDKRITNLSTPSAYGELRWNAAIALTTERLIQNMGDTALVLENSFEPLDVAAILMLIADTTFTVPAGSEWPSRLTGIRDAGNLPMGNYEFRAGQAPRKV